MTPDEPNETLNSLIFPAIRPIERTVKSANVSRDNKIWSGPNWGIGVVELEITGKVLAKQREEK